VLTRRLQHARLRYRLTRRQCHIVLYDPLTDVGQDKLSKNGNWAGLGSRRSPRRSPRSSNITQQIAGHQLSGVHNNRPDALQQSTGPTGESVGALFVLYRDRFVALSKAVDRRRGCVTAK
jgi:hypothetical protein